MVTIRIVAGAGTGPTPVAAFDTALTAVGAERFNLVRLSSVIPTAATLNEAEDLSDLGAIGDRLHVVQASVTVEAGMHGCAGLRWTRTVEGSGLFYEEVSTGADAESVVSSRLDDGIEHGLALRSWSPATGGSKLSTVTAEDDAYGCAVVLAAYGQANDRW